MAWRPTLGTYKIVRGTPDQQQHIPFRVRTDITVRKPATVTLDTLYMNLKGAEHKMITLYSTLAIFNQ